MELTITDLSFAYHEDAYVFQNLSLDFDKRATAIIGQNGAGKTTLVKLLKGLLKPQTGAILLDDVNIQALSVTDIAARVGLVFQNPDDQIFKNTVLDEVMFGPLSIGMTTEQSQISAQVALKQVNLENYMEVNPFDLSLSQRKMIAIASILAMQTQVVILDEPTIAQDAHGKQIIKEIITFLQEKGVLVISILHDMDFVAECFERVIVLTNGQILADGTPSAVFSQHEVLEHAHLEQPFIMQLANELGIHDEVMSVDELITKLK